ncbi:MAG: hypothetical protein WCC87_17810 [Candidatus Korobacteraceae bacterium]
MKSKMNVDESQTACPLTPDMLSQLKKEDMKQAIVERFSVRKQAPSRAAVRTAKRSS